MPYPNFISIVKNAWQNYDQSRTIKSVHDISANVSTNHVYRIDFEGDQPVIAKLSYFGHYEHFVEDHTIINGLANNLPSPYENLLSRSLMKGNNLYIYRHHDSLLDAWVVFYRPIEIKQRLPRRLDKNHIVSLGEQFAHFHKSCYSIRNTLPTSSKTQRTDIDHLQDIIETELGQFEHRLHQSTIKKHCQYFIENCTTLKSL